MTTNPIAADDVDLSDFEFWVGDRDLRESAFKQLRDMPGLHFNAERVLEDSPFPPGPGYWSLVRHEDVWAASRNPQLFCSGQGSNIADLPQELNEFFGSMINMDDPKHFRLRSIVSKGFTPEGGRHGRGVRQGQGGRGRRPHARAPPGPAVRLRRGDRRPAAAADHLRDDGHPRRRHRADLPVDQRHPRCRRPRVRRHATRR